MKIYVTDNDIEQGIPHDTTFCPVALALYRTTGDQDVNVGGFRARSNHRFYALPKRVQNWIRRFDRGQPVKPFSFVLDSPLW